MAGRGLGGIRRGLGGDWERTGRELGGDWEGAFRVVRGVIWGFWDGRM